MTSALAERPVRATTVRPGQQGQQGQPAEHPEAPQGMQTVVIRVPKMPEGMVTAQPATELALPYPNAKHQVSDSDRISDIHRPVMPSVQSLPLRPRRHHRQDPERPPTAHRLDDLTLAI
jgi:hypothetical protein